jgi:hypothetical protein
MPPTGDDAIDLRVVSSRPLAGGERQARLGGASVIVGQDERVRVKQATNDPATRRSLVVWVAGGCVVAVGLGVLAGWMFEVPILKNPLSGLVQMKANVAVGFVALGASLLLTHCDGRKAGVLGRGLAVVWMRHPT